MFNTVGPRLLRRLGHCKTDAIFGVDAIFEGWLFEMQYLEVDLSFKTFEIDSYYTHLIN